MLSDGVLGPHLQGRWGLEDTSHLEASEPKACQGRAVGRRGRWPAGREIERLLEGGPGTVCSRPCRGFTRVTMAGPLSARAQEMTTGCCSLDWAESGWRRGHKTFSVLDRKPP